MGLGISAGLGLGGTSGGSNTSPSLVELTVTNGYGSTNTKIQRYTNVVTDSGADLTLTQSATDGDSVTINTAGWYSISTRKDGSAATSFGVSKNSNQLTTSINAITLAHALIQTDTPAANFTNQGDTTILLAGGEVIRPHTNGATAGTSNARTRFRIEGPL